MATPEQVELFASLFRGRPDAYARYWEKNGRSGYSPAYSFDWNEFNAHRNTGGSLKTFEHKTLLPFTSQVVADHLNGRSLVGVYPILSDNTSYFLAADFDKAQWLDDARAYLNAAKEAGLTGYLEKSKSGNGGHVWIFFDAPCLCYKSRCIGFEIIRRAFRLSPFEKEVSFDRLFPNQDSLPTEGFGNLIALPLQGEFARNGTMVFINPDTGGPIADQWAYLAAMKRYSAAELDHALEELETGSFYSIPHRDTGELTLTVRNQIELDRTLLTPRTIRFLKEELNFLSTEYLAKRRVGKSVHDTRKYFKLIEEVGDSIFVPRGFLDRLTAFLQAEGIAYETEREHTDFPNVSFTSAIKLTPSQETCVGEMLQHDQGILVAPPGSGKTMMGMELIARRGLPALVLVHRKELLDQWVESVETYLNIPKMKIGRYSGIKKSVGKEITIGLLQSFSRAVDKAAFTNRFGTVIVDECHHIPATTFSAVIRTLNPDYLYGLTATPKRKHNDEKLIYAYMGDIVSTMSPSGRTERTSVAHSLVPEVVVKETALEIPFEWKTDRFQLLAKIISFDTARNRLIANDITEQVSRGERVLVLSERKEHLDILALCLKGRCETIVITGDDTSAKRVSKLKRIKSGKYQAILSTGQFFGEGMDVHNISVLVLAFPFSFEGKLMQYIGRLLHGSDPKLVLDYRDTNVAFLERQYKQRQRYYNKLAKDERGYSSG